MAIEQAKEEEKKNKWKRVEEERRGCSGKMDRLFKMYKKCASDVCFCQ